MFGSFPIEGEPEGSLSRVVLGVSERAATWILGLPGG